MANNRIKKKLKKRLGHIHYHDARIAKISQYVKETYPNTNLIIIKTTKRGKITKVIAAQDAYPSSKCHIYMS